MRKDEVCIIRAKLKEDYVYNALKNYGYDICVPYRGGNIILRIFREFWFRLGLPGKHIWYRKEINRRNYKCIIMYDPLIMPEYIMWVKNNHPKAKLVLSYENRADRTISPLVVPEGVEKWSYDQDDCKKYDMKWSAPAFFKGYVRERKRDPKYDIIYVGRDKGRAEKLIEIETKLNEMGLKTYFHICPDRQFLRFKKRYYKRLLTYDEYLELLIDTKAILNIVPEGQKSVTQREMEAVFDGIKCITNNAGIRDFELFSPSTFFLLEANNLDKVPEFLSYEMREKSVVSIEDYEIDSRIQQMIEQ